MKSIITFLTVSLITLSSFGQDQMFDICPLKVGEEIPENIKITSVDGKSVDMREVLSEKSVLVFYRGGWCPYCIRHLAALNEALPTIDSLGYQLLAITPDQFDSLGVSTERSSSEYELYSDSEINAIEAFGLGWKIEDERYKSYIKKYDLDMEEWSGQKHHILPVPAVYIIKDGKVEFNYINPNYSIRLKPSTLIAVLESLSE